MKIAKNIENLMLQKITGFDKNQLFLGDYKLKEFQKKKLEEYKKRYLYGEPIEYIINKAEFYGFDFYVDSRVLIPRNDTEIMVDKVVESIKLNNFKNINTILIDIGTGSACIPISILKILSTDGFNHLKKTYAIDISKDALEVAKINIKEHNLEDKIELIQSDLLKDLLYKIKNKSGQIKNILGQTHRSAPIEDIGVNLCVHPIVITANLPYIKNGDVENMDKQTIKFEPDLALYGGEKTGFELYEKLIFHIMSTEGFSPLNQKTQGSLAPCCNIGDIQGAKDSCYSRGNIILFIEIGFDQKQIAIDFLKKQNLKFEIFKDNGGIDRCIKIYF